MHRFIVLACTCVGALLGSAVNSLGAAEPGPTPTLIVLPLWSGPVPDETATLGLERSRPSPKLSRQQVEVTESTRLITDVSTPTLTVFQPAPERRTGTAAIICPGGGYWDLYWQLEGEEVAAWLNSIGVTGLLLKYRVPRRADDPQGQPARRPLQDVQRAIRVARQHAAEWGLKTNRIGTIGFSAGGHLAIAAALRFGQRTYPRQDAVDDLSCRPDFAIPVYSGYLKAENSLEVAPGLEVPTNAPPAFLVHGSNDLISSPEHSVAMYLALRKARVSAELHLYADTAHDFAARPSPRPYGQWTEACRRWLEDRNLLPAIAR